MLLHFCSYHILELFSACYSVCPIDLLGSEGFLRFGCICPCIYGLPDFYLYSHIRTMLHARRYTVITWLGLGKRDFCFRSSFSPQSTYRIWPIPVAEDNREKYLVCALDRIALLQRIWQSQLYVLSHAQRRVR